MHIAKYLFTMLFAVTAACSSTKADSQTPASSAQTGAKVEGASDKDNRGDEDEEKPDDDDDDDEEDGDADEREIPLTAVPDSIKQAALGAVPNIVLVEAEVEIEEGVTVYEIEGRVGDVEYEIEVSADGKVLEVEKQDADD